MKVNINFTVELKLVKRKTNDKMASKPTKKSINLKKKENNPIEKCIFRKCDRKLRTINPLNIFANFIDIVFFLNSTKRRRENIWRTNAKCLVHCAKSQNIFREYVETSKDDQIVIAERLLSIGFVWNIIHSHCGSTHRNIVLSLSFVLSFHFTCYLLPFCFIHFGRFQSIQMHHGIVDSQ